MAAVTASAEPSTESSLPSRRRPMRRVVLVVVLACVFVVGLGLRAAHRPTPHTLEGAISVASDDGRFASSPRAANALAEISRILTTDARACAARRTAAEPACAARASAAAIAQSAAVTVLHCTQ